MQVQPQLHHLDALDEMPSRGGGGRGSKAKKDAEEEKPIEAEARTVDVKVKGAEEEQAAVAGNLYLLKQMQEDKWVSYDWVDAEVLFYCSVCFCLFRRRANIYLTDRRLLALL